MSAQQFRCAHGDQWVQLTGHAVACPTCGTSSFEVAHPPSAGASPGGEVYEVRQYLDQAMRALRDAEDWARLRTGNEPLATRVRQIHEQLTDDVMNGKLNVPSAPDDLKEALDKLLEIMGMDKGPTEQEWVEWANRTLPLMQRHGRLTNVLDYS